MPETGASASDSSITHPKWTIESFAAYTEARWRAEEKFQAERDRRYTEALELASRNADQALSLALTEIKGRLDVLNNLRTEVVEDRAVLVRLDRHESDFARLADRITANERYITAQQGRTGGAVDLRSLVIALAGLAIGVAGIVLVVMTR